MDVDFLRSLPLFMPLREEETALLLRQFTQKVLKRGDFLFRQGDDGKEMYVVERGSIKVIFEDTLSGQKAEIAHLGPGAVLGEMALIDPAPRSAAAICDSPCIVQSFSSGTFNQLRSQQNSAAYSLLRSITLVLCERLRTVNDQIALLMGKPQTYLETMGLSDHRELLTRSKRLITSLQVKD